MKKLLLTAVTLLIMAVAAKAQASVQAGFMLNRVKTEDAAVKVAGYYKGFMLQADYNLNIAGEFSVAPGLGIDYSFNNFEGMRYKELGLFAPIDLNYRFPLSDNFSLSIFAGPTFYYGLLAKETSTKPHYDYYDKDCKRFDVSLGGGIWVDVIDNIRVKIGYKFGLMNTSKLEGIKERNNCFSISVGYVF